LAGMSPLDQAEAARCSQQLSRSDRVALRHHVPHVNAWTILAADWTGTYLLADARNGASTVAVMGRGLDGQGVFSWPSLPEFLNACLWCLRNRSTLLDRRPVLTDGWLEWRHQEARVQSLEEFAARTSGASMTGISRGPSYVEYNLLLVAAVDADGNTAGDMPTEPVSADGLVAANTPSWLLLNCGLDHAVTATARRGLIGQQGPPDAQLRVQERGGLVFWSLTSGRESELLEIDGDVAVYAEASGRQLPPGSKYVERWSLLCSTRPLRL